jgi:hypothetical protein
MFHRGPATRGISRYDAILQAAGDSNSLKWATIPLRIQNADRFTAESRTTSTGIRGIFWVHLC